MSMPLIDVANQFAFAGKVKAVKPLGEGLINETFFVETADNAPSYILQRKNKNIFTDIPAMMDNIKKVTEHIKKKVVAAGGNPLREALTVIPTVDGKLCYKDDEGELWAGCLFIDDTLAYQFADSPELAEQGGRGIGKFQAMLSDMKEPLADILPGFATALSSGMRRCKRTLPVEKRRWLKKLKRLKNEEPKCWRFGIKLSWEKYQPA